MLPDCALGRGNRRLSPCNWSREGLIGIQERGLWARRRRIRTFLPTLPLAKLSGHHRQKGCRTSSGYTLRFPTGGTPCRPINSTLGGTTFRYSPPHELPYIPIFSYRQLPA